MSEVLDYIVFMHRIVAGSNHDRCFILNMEQTPVYFAMSAKQTLELIGKKPSTSTRRRTTQNM